MATNRRLLNAGKGPVRDLDAERKKANELEAAALTNTLLYGNAYKPLQPKSILKKDFVTGDVRVQTPKEMKEADAALKKVGDNQKQRQVTADSGTSVSKIKWKQSVVDYSKTNDTSAYTDFTDSVIKNTRESRKTEYDHNKKLENARKNRENYVKAGASGRNPSSSVYTKYDGTKPVSKDDVIVAGNVLAEKVRNGTATDDDYRRYVNTEALYGEGLYNGFQNRIESAPKYHVAPVVDSWDKTGIAESELWKTEDEYKKEASALTSEMQSAFSKYAKGEMSDADINTFAEKFQRFKAKENAYFSGRYQKTGTLATADALKLRRDAARDANAETDARIKAIDMEVANARRGSPEYFQGLFAEKESLENSKTNVDYKDTEGKYYSALQFEAEKADEDNYNKYVEDYTANVPDSILNLNPEQVEDKLYEYTGSLATPVTAELVDYGTDDELKTYLYLFEKYGKETADNYARSAKYVLNKRVAEEHVKKYEDSNALERFGMGVGAVFEGGIGDIGQSITGLGKALFRDTSYTHRNTAQQKADAVIEAEQNPVADILMQGGRSAVANSPAIIAGIATGGSSLASTSVLFASAAGSAYVDAVNKGNGYFNALGYGIANGAIEAATEKLFDIPGFYGGSKVDDAFKGIISKGVSKLSMGTRGKTALNFLGYMTANGFGEAVEEGITAAVEPTLGNIFLGEKNESFTAEHFGDIGYAALLGTVSSFLMPLSYVSTYADAKGDTAVRAIFNGEKITDKQIDTVVGNESSRELFEKIMGFELSENKDIAKAQVKAVASSAKATSETIKGKDVSSVVENIDASSVAEYTEAVSDYITEPDAEYVANETAAVAEMTEIANKELEKTTVDEKAVSETAAGGIKIDKDGSIVLPTAEEEWDAAVERSNIKKNETEKQKRKTVKDELTEAAPELQRMESVSDINFPATKLVDGQQKTVILDAYSRVLASKGIGDKVYRNDIGEIDIGTKRIKKGLKYLSDDSEYLAVLAIPDVLEKGIHISTDTDHDNRGYPTFTFAAPVNINGKSGYMAVVVKRTGTNKYKMHRVLSPDGSILDFSDSESLENERSTGYNDKMTVETDGESLSITNASDSIISQDTSGVKIEKDGSIMLPTAEGEINAAAANKKDILPGFSDVTTETTEMTGRACGVSEENIGIAVRLSHALGVKVAFYEDLTSDERGQYLPNTGVIWVNSKYQDVFSNVFGHELTHRIESSKFYKALDRFVAGKLKAEGKSMDELIRRKKESYSRRGASLSDEAARREVVAKYVGEVLLNNEAVIADIANTDRGLGGFLLSKIDGLVAKITGKNKEAVYIRRVQQMFRKALEDVSRKEDAKVSDGSEQQRGSVYEDAGLNELAERYRRGDLSQAEYLEAYNEYMERNPGLEDEDFFEGRSFDLDDLKEEEKKFDKRLYNEFRKQLLDVKGKNFSPNEHLVIGRTPKLLLDIGFNPLPLTINYKHADYSLNNSKNEDHFISGIDLATIASSISNPIAVIENPRDSSRALAIVDIKANGKNVICSIEVESTSNRNTLTFNSNQIVTAHGQALASEWLYKAIEKELNGNTSVFYINNKKAIPLLKSSGRQLPAALGRSDGFVHSIHDKGSNIKIPMDDITESLQFKNWFGKHNKRNSSKIVDKNGNPLTMYRGDENPIYIYEKDTNPPKGLPDLGKGIYFTSNKDVAKEQGKYFSEVFLNVRKPFNVFEESGDFYESIANYARISLESINRDNANDILKKRGFDGVVQYDSDNNIKNVVVFDPHQAKNANGGLGLYDSDNPDRRYDFDDANDFADDEMLYDSSFAAKYDPNNSERSKAIRKEREKRKAERKADEFSSRGLEGKDWWSKNRNKADRMFNKRELERLSRIKSELEDADELTVEQVTSLWGEMRKLQRNVTAMSMAHQITNEELTQVTDLLRGDRTIEDIEKLPADRYNIDGIIAVAKAKLEYENVASQIREFNARRKAKLHETADGLIKDADIKDKSGFASGLRYRRETMERNVRDVVKDKAAADAIIGEYFSPVHKNEADRTRFKEKLRNRIRELKISTKVEKGNQVSEAYAVQFYGEVADNIAYLEQNQNRVKHREGKDLEEWRNLEKALWEDNPNLDKGKIEKAVEEFRKIYDELYQDMNEVRVRNGYEPVKYRRGYFPHFAPGTSDGILAKIAKGLGINSEVTDLPTSINGMTHTFKPGIRWMGNILERTGFATEYDALKGFDRYLEAASDVIFHTDDIQRLRAFSSRIRYNAGDEGIKKRADDIRKREGLSETEKQTLLDELYKDGKFTGSGFTVALDDYINVLAGKKQLADRDAEYNFGRKMYNVVKGLESRVAANMIAGNLASALTNFIPITQAASVLDPKVMTVAAYKTLQSMINGGDGIQDTSDFLTNRRGSDLLALKTSEKISKALSKPMEFIDSFASGTIVRARFYDNLQRGMSEDAALEEADSFAASVMADRSKGSMPVLFEQKNPLMKLFTQFQLEVNNQLSFATKDLWRDESAKAEHGKNALTDKAVLRYAFALFRFALMAFLFDELYEWLIGRRPALDPIGMIKDYAEDAEEDGWFKALGGLGEDVAENMPFVGGLMGGGRVPISSALPDIGKIYSSLSGNSDSEKKASVVTKELTKPLYYLAPPFAGGAGKKLIEGGYAAIKGGSYTVDKDGRDVLQYPVYNDSAGNAVVNGAGAVLFGKTTTSGGRKWVEDGFKNFTADYTEAYKGMIELDGVTQKEAYEFLDGLRNVKDPKKGDDVSVDDLKRQYIEEAGIDDSAKGIAYYYALASENEKDVLDSYRDDDSFGEVYKVLSEFKNFDKDAEKRKVLEGASLDNDDKGNIYYEFLASDREKAVLDGYRDDDSFGALYGVLSGMKEYENKVQPKRELLLESELDGDVKRNVYENIIIDSGDAEKEAERLNAFEKVGLDIDDYLEARVYKYELEQTEEMKPAHQASAFAKWADNTYKPKQADIIKSTLTFSSGQSVTAEAYEKYRGAGLSPDEAYELIDNYYELEPENGKEQVSDWQKARVIVDGDLSDEDKLTSLGVVLSSGTYERVSTAYDKGISFERYFDVKDEYDSRKANYSADEKDAYAYRWNSSHGRTSGKTKLTFNQIMMYEAIEGIGGDLTLSAGGITTAPKYYFTKHDKAVLWQILDGKWSHENNPFDTSVGLDVRKSMGWVD